MFFYCADRESGGVTGCAAEVVRYCMGNIFGDMKEVFFGLDTGIVHHKRS